jgi:hypothetical protein
MRPHRSRFQLCRTVCLQIGEAIVNQITRRRAGVEALGVAIRVRLIPSAQLARRHQQCEAAWSKSEAGSARHGSCDSAQKADSEQKGFAAIGIKADRRRCVVDLDIAG